MVKTIAVDDKDHKQFKQISLDRDTPMNELFHQLLERVIWDGDRE
jgi:hypothetical protein